MGGVAAGATYDVIFSTQASLRRMRTCLLAFHVTDEYRHDDVIDQQAGAGFHGSTSDDVMMAGGKEAPAGHLLNMHEEDVEEVSDNDVYDMTKDESRSTLDYRKAESVV